MKAELTHVPGVGTHVSADTEQSDELFALFHGDDIECDLVRRGIGGMDVIDFGKDPARLDDIERIFNSWKSRN